MLGVINGLDSFVELKEYDNHFTKINKNEVASERFFFIICFSLFLYVLVKFENMMLEDAI